MTPDPDNIAGLWRGVIVSTDDEQFRARYKVRVPEFFAESIPVDHLPWAESALGMASKNAGDSPPLSTGDVVWVMFERGRREHPVIVGAAPSRSANFPDLPTAVTSDYAQNRKRWRRQDRQGNLVELSEKSDEMWVRLRSGRAEVMVSKRDNSVRLRSTGPLQMQGAGGEIRMAASLLVEAATLLLRADLMRLTGKDAVLSADNEVKVGHDVDPVTGLSTQADKASLQPEELVLGQYEDTAQAKTLVASLRALQSVAIQSGGELTVEADGTISIKGVAGVRIESDADVDVKAQVARIEAAIEAVVKSEGQASIEAVGQVDVNSSAQVTVRAPLISFEQV